MRFSHELSYDAAPDEVRAMLGERAFREKVCAAMRALRHEVRIDSSGPGMEVLVDQTQPAHGIPSFAKKLVGDEIQIVQRESWRDGTSASLDIEIPGKPGRLIGSITLAGQDGGTVETVSGDLKVNVPLVGGKLENLIADLLRSALRAEQRVGRAWLAGER